MHAEDPPHHVVYVVISCREFCYVSLYICWVLPLLYMYTCYNLAPLYLRYAYINIHLHTFQKYTVSGLWYWTCLLLRYLCIHLLLQEREFSAAFDLHGTVYELVQLLQLPARTLLTPPHHTHSHRRHHCSPDG